MSGEVQTESRLTVSTNVSVISILQNYPESFFKINIIVYGVHGFSSRRHLKVIISVSGSNLLQAYGHDHAIIESMIDYNQYSLSPARSELSANQVCRMDGILPSRVSQGIVMRFGYIMSEAEKSGIVVGEVLKMKQGNKLF
jgi:hypothetical protein